LNDEADGGLKPYKLSEDVGEQNTGVDVGVRISLLGGEVESFAV
jgi:hypothetical protein